MRGSEVVCLNVLVLPSFVSLHAPAERTSTSPASISSHLIHTHNRSSAKGPTAIEPKPSKQQAQQLRKRKKLEQLKKGPVTVSVLSAVNKLASGESTVC